MGLQNKGTYNEQLFCFLEVQSTECIFYFKFVI